MTITLSDIINYYSNFKDTYIKILKSFKFDYKSDKYARNLLHKIILKKSKDYNLEKVLNSIKNLVNDKEIILIYGCGPSLEETMKFTLEIKGSHIFNNFINLCADGSSRFLRDNDIPVDIIFTDLDGITEREFLYSKFLIVHAHGDNINKLQAFEKLIINFDNIIGTTQVEPTKNVLNPGGFTDGDRVLFFLKSLLRPTQVVFLIGMDFDKIVGKYSKIDKLNNFKASRIKRKKLKYAKFLLEQIQKQIVCPIYYVNSTTKSKRIHNLTLSEFKEFVLDKF
ncbi:MAG: 6-hydroxymethylpterin diphosphokinase MptE-like protein [Promethearchaeota archaeon]